MAASSNEPTDAGAAGGADNSTSVLSKLPDSQVFARDPEQYDAEAVQDTVARLAKVLVRIRKARADDAQVKEAAAKLKKANAAAKKAKAKKAGKVPADPMETVI